MLNTDQLDVLLVAAESGENVRVSAHDLEFNHSIANLNVKESLDMARYLYAESGLDSTGRKLANRFKYEIPTRLIDCKVSEGMERKDHMSYDYLVALGCRSCNSSVDFKSSHLFFDRDNGNRMRPELKCQSCGDTIAPIFSSNCTDSCIDSCRMSATFGRGNEGEKAYMYGFRQGCEFGDSGKRWWKDYTRSKKSQSDDSTSLFMAKNANKNAREIVKQLCDKCGCEEAYYSTFQARSADEGMTVMFECKGCKNRTVVNT